MIQPHSLPALLRWFRSEWTAELGSGRIHVHLTDPGGDPEWHERFRQLINGVDIETPDGIVRGGDLRAFPLRWHLRDMSKGGRHGYRRARFLFVLACQDFNVRDAARVISPAGFDEHGQQWAMEYAEGCLRRLWHGVHDPARNHEDGKPRTFVEKRISKSEAQAAAEAA